MNCDRCDNPATLIAYATYDLDDPYAVHPRLARYPAPMIRTCGRHLAQALKSDASAPGSTRGWFIQPVPE